MAIFTKTVQIERSVFYQPVGELIFVYAKTFGGLTELIGQHTHLCKILDVHFLENKCASCGSPKFNVEYLVEIVDSPDETKIGNQFNISRDSANASKLQIKASYFGTWGLGEDEAVADDLRLIKPIHEPTLPMFEETVDLLHISIPNAYKLSIIPKSELDDRSIQILRDNYHQLKYIGYGTLFCDDEGGKVKGWWFEFEDSSIDFQYH